MTTHKGIYYFPRYEAAKLWAEVNRWPTNRIYSYQIGYAVQLHPSGTYAGPDVDITKHHCDWCEEPGGQDR